MGRKAGSSNHLNGMKAPVQGVLGRPSQIESLPDVHKNPVADSC